MEISKSEKSSIVNKENYVIETEAQSLIDSSNILVTKLGEYLRNNSEIYCLINEYL